MPELYLRTLAYFRDGTVAVVSRPSHILSVPHKVISESPACLNCGNGVRGSFAGPLVKSTYVKLTGNAQTAQLDSSLRLSLIRNHKRPCKKFRADLGCSEIV